MYSLRQSWETYGLLAVDFFSDPWCGLLRIRKQLIGSNPSEKYISNVLEFSAPRIKICQYFY